MHRSQETDVDK